MIFWNTSSGISVATCRVTCHSQGLNYVWVTILFMALFTQIENDPRRVHNPTSVHVYETEYRLPHQRIHLTTLAHNGEDEECLEMMVRESRNPRAGFLNHIYWDDVDESLSKSVRRKG